MIRIRKELDLSGIEGDIVKALEDENVKLAINQTFADMCNPYVPMDTGYLANSVQVTPEYVYYPAEYAEYMYMGQVYSPNIPIVDKEGNIIGWTSPKGKPKHPTGREIHYSNDKHPLATKQWDEAMLRDKGDEFSKAVADIIYRRLQE